MLNLLLPVILATILSSGSAMSGHNTAVFRADASQQDSDPISGEWDVSFRVDASKTPATFTLKLEGDKVSGTAYSEHTGPGKLRDGTWSNHKLSFTVDFASHESIVVTGALKDGRLAGEFRTEGFVSDWEAKKKNAAAKSAAGENGSPTSADPVSGQWNAIFQVAERKVDVTLKFMVEGAKLTGTSESSIAGSGTLSNGSWTNNTMSFTMPGPHGPVSVTGVLKDGKLQGTFSMGEMKGTWEAKR
jgi:hypothetical protein